MRQAALQRETIPAREPMNWARLDEAEVRLEEMVSNLTGFKSMSRARHFQPMAAARPGFKFWSLYAIMLVAVVMVSNLIDLI